MKLTGIATRAFNTPLLIEQNKLDVIVRQVIAPRLTAIPAEAVMFEADRSERRPYALTTDGIAVIDIADTLVRKASGLDAWSGLTSYEQLRADLNTAATDSAVRGIFLEIDSPGGEVGGLFDLADAIYEMRGAKPIFASVSEMACSAAYALASAADRIFITRTGCAGSIGVVCCHVDESAADAKAGLKYTYIHAGAKKVEGNPHEPLSPEAKADFQAEIDRVYDIFTATVARNRKISEKAVRATEAGVFFGEDAVAERLADEVGTPEQALEALRTRMGSTKIAGVRAEDAALEILAQTSSTEADASAPNSTKEATEMAKLDRTADAEDQKKIRAAMKDEECKTSERDDEEDDEDEDDEDEKPSKKSRKASASVDAVEIAELCEISGMKELTGDFIKASMSVKQVRSELLKRRAEESNGRRVDANFGVAQRAAASALEEISANAEKLSESRGISRAQATLEILKRNPHLYEAYVDERPGMMSSRSDRAGYLAKITPQVKRQGLGTMLDGIHVTDIAAQYGFRA